MKTSNMTKGALLVLCMASMGCVAEEAKQASPEPSPSVEKIDKLVDAKDQTKPESVINAGDDELYFTDRFKEILLECGHDGPCVFVFDNLAVKFGPIIVFQEKYFEIRLNKSGKVYWPVGANSTKAREYKEMEVEVYCKIQPDFRLGDYNKNPDKIFRSCSISSDPKYFIKFIE